MRHEGANYTTPCLCSEARQWFRFTSLSLSQCGVEFHSSTVIRGPTAPLSYGVPPRRCCHLIQHWTHSVSTRPFIYSLRKASQSCQIWNYRHNRECIQIYFLKNQSCIHNYKCVCETRGTLCACRVHVSRPCGCVRTSVLT